MPHREQSSQSATSTPVRAVLVAPRVRAPDDVSLTELTSLLAGLDVLVVHTLTQKHAPLDSPHLLGKGKLQELQGLVEANRSPAGELVVVVASDTTPAEQRALERSLGVAVLDRTGVILRVFERRAQTRLARLEVELARLLHALPRVRDDTSRGDREGGGGRGGRGNSNVQLEKQRLRRGVTDVRERIEEEQAMARQQRRRRSEIPHAALVGYTNAGKSSLMRALTGSDVLVEDRLFATLGTTVRAISGSSPRVLLSDTVGFLRELPHELLQSFRSTLETSLEAGLLVYVLDASDPAAEEQLQVTRSVLEQMGGAEIPSISVLTKSDRLSAEERARIAAEHPEALVVNTFDAADVARVRGAILSFFDEAMSEATVEVPFTEGKRLAELRRMGHVVRESLGEAGLVVTLRAPAARLSRLLGRERAS